MTKRSTQPQFCACGKTARYFAKQSCDVGQTNALLQAGSCREQAHLPPPNRHCRRCSAITQVVLVADGQVTMGGTVVKPNVRKTRKIGESTIGGFAGALSGGGNTNSFHALTCCL